MKLTVHIIDDNDAVRDSTRALFECLGYEVREHASAEAFLDCDRRENTGYLIVDHHMPGMTGLDLLEHLRAQGDRAPALVLTGRSDPTIAARASRFGVKCFNKPVEEDRLLEWIEAAQQAGI